VISYSFGIPHWEGPKKADWTEIKRDMKKNTDALINVNKETGLELNRQNQNVGQNRKIKIANRSIENVAKLKYLELE
jgi:ribonucleotide reductase alpha subunit